MNKIYIYGLFQLDEDTYQEAMEVWLKYKYYYG